MLFLLQMKVIQRSKLNLVLPILLLLLLMAVSVDRSSAQILFLKNTYDTNYICSYTEDFTGRAFSSISSAGLAFADKNLSKNLAYAIHSKLNIGLGFNYSIIGINFGFSPFHNSLADDKYGQTKSFDFRMNMYGRSIIFDLYFMTHQGFYLSNPESILKDWPKGDTFPLRPDIQLFSTGLVAQYIFNHQKFSMRATYVQNEWQKKSAGSFLVGGEFFYSHFQGDSSFIPDQVEPPEFLGGNSFDNSLSINLGISGGYSHTFVIKQHVFIALGASIGPQMSYSAFKSSEENLSNAGVTFGFNLNFRTGFGYNSEKFYIGVFLINENLYHELSHSDASSLFTMGILKLNFAYRFTLKKPIKFLNPNYWKCLQPKADRK